MFSKLVISAAIGLLVSCTTFSQKVDVWLTRPNQSLLLQKQTPQLSFQKAAASGTVISINPKQTFQTMDGFGYTLTGGSANLIHSMNAGARKALLQELFGKEDNSISISYLRISIGASDLDENVFSYNDLDAGETDPELKQFNLAPDKRDLIPVLKEILDINPKITILGSPWSPPEWMKDNENSKGGSLKKEFYSVYANYLVKYIQQMQKEGIDIDAITPQNEPLHPGNNPSLLMVAKDQAEFIRDHLGPAFKKADLKTKIIIYDHNCDKPEYPITVLNDPGAKAYIDGSAFHMYAGDISALSKVHDAHPDKHLYFTEQYTASTGEFAGDFKWHIKNLIIGAPRNWSRTVLEWNLANDPEFGPHTPGGCTTCRGALTIDGSEVKRNVAYYIIAQASKFVPAGSVRIESSNASSIQTIAYKTPQGKIVLIAFNDSNTKTPFSIQFETKLASFTLDAGEAASFVWK